MEEEKRIIREVTASLESTPRDQVTEAAYIENYEEIFKISQALEREAKSEYDRVQLSYLKSHLVRYALTLAHIPASGPDEVVLEVGSYGFFSYLLRELRGYANIVSLDYFPDGPKAGERELRILDKSIRQKYLNVNLDDVSQYPQEAGVFSKIFFFEVLEHLINPIEAMGFLKRLLAPNGRLFLSTPNCCSLLCLRNLFSLLVPMNYSAFNPRRWDTHFREWTPFTIKYLLNTCGMREERFDVFYCFSEQSKYPADAFLIYPFPGEARKNAFFLGDDLFSISSPTSKKCILRPNLFYDFAKFFSAYIELFPEKTNLDFFIGGLSKK